MQVAGANLPKGRRRRVGRQWRPQPAGRTGPSPGAEENPLPSTGCPLYFFVTRSAFCKALLPPLGAKCQVRCSLCAREASSALRLP